MVWECGGNTRAYGGVQQAMTFVRDFHTDVVPGYIYIHYTMDTRGPGQYAASRR